MEREKLGELYDKYIEGLIYFIFSYVHNMEEAEDIAEDVFVEILLHPDRFKKASSEKTFLYAIGKNKAIDHIRKESKVVAMNPEDEEGLFNIAAKDDVPAEILIKERNEELLSALNSINENYRLAIYLSYFEEMSNQEIADIMKVNKKKVENYLYRGKNELKGFEI